MKITLLCALGMSTSLLVERMKKSAEKRGIEAEIVAHAADQIDKQLKTADVILLGPQIRYKKKELFEKAKRVGVPIDIIDMRTYGSTNGDQALEQALKLMK